MKTIRFLRREACLTQIELASILQIPRHKIQLHEQGLRPIDRREKERIIGFLESLLEGQNSQLPLFINTESEVSDEK